MACERAKNQICPIREGGVTQPQSQHQAPLFCKPGAARAGGAGRVSGKINGHRHRASPNFYFMFVFFVFCFLF